ncbi:MAG: hypothetical protein QOJ99_3727 [Bryobacterales bacterium]|jgi:hypothetical protein|nr:hypothetical protein [Bryobacterales bacterium]
MARLLNEPNMGPRYNRAVWAGDSSPPRHLLAVAVYRKRCESDLSNGRSNALHSIMPDNLLTRLDQISSEVLPGKIRTEARGENYYVFEMTDAAGTRSALPPIWIDPRGTDQQIRDKLRRELEQALHPESGPDDSSVPNLQTEGKRA